MIESVAPVSRVMMLVEINNPNRISTRFAEAFANSGIDFHTTTVVGRGPLHDQLEAQRFPAHALGCTSAVGYIGGARRLAALCRNLGTQIIHAVEPIPAAVAILARWMGSGAKVVYNRQHVTSSHYQQTWLSRFSAQFADLTMTVSKASAAAAVEVDGAARNRVVVAYNPAPELREVPAEEIRELRSRLGIPEDASIVAIVARIRVEKGHGTLMAAMELVSARCPLPVHLVIVGAGPYEQEVRAYAAASRICDRIHFVGHHLDVAPWFALADVVANPSDRDACPIAVIEAMSASKPIVATHVGGIPELVEAGRTGILVPPSDPPALADALLAVLRSTERARSLGECARVRYAERFTVAAAVQRYLEVYTIASQA